MNIHNDYQFSYSWNAYLISHVYVKIILELKNLSVVGHIVISQTRRAYLLPWVIKPFSFSTTVYYYIVTHGNNLSI